MKALTVRQPWASLIASGVKTIETRPWRPKSLEAGETFAIHAATAKFGYSPVTVDTGRHYPLGAIVATCQLVDVVPMVEPGHAHPESFRRGDAWLSVGEVIEGDPRDLHLIGPDGWRNVSDQRPYGDYAQGRFAWLLGDVMPTTERCPACMGTTERWLGAVQVVCICGDTGKCEPVPARGRQGLWEWTP